MTYYTEVFSENVAKGSVFDDLGWWLYPSHCLFPVYRVRAVYEHCTQNRKLADREEIFSEFDKNCFGV